MRGDEIVYLEVEDVEAAHDQGLEASGGSSGLRSRGLLESAVMAPRSAYLFTLAELAAAYIHGIAKNHAFVDGNKRTALLSGLLFLRLNGYDLALGKEWVDIVVSLASDGLSRAELAERIARELPNGDPVGIES